MKTDAERLRIALNFVNGPDVEYHKNVVQLREDLASFSGIHCLSQARTCPILTTAGRTPSVEAFTKSPQGSI